MILKGQNLRVLAIPVDAHSDPIVIAMATSCNIQLTNNVDNTTTKNDVGLATKQNIVSKAWQVHVDSLNVLDANTILNEIKNLRKFTLMWDEVSTTDNQTPDSADYQRIGHAYLTDATFTWNDREFASKNLTFTGVAPFEHDTQVPTTVIGAGTYTRGQFVRLFLSADNTATPTSVIAAAKQLSLHVGVQLADATTKDTDGDFLYQEPVSISYDITTQALVKSDETITSTVAAKGLADLETIYEGNTPVKWLIANVGGANNRTLGSTIVSGSAILTQLQINAAVQQNATYQATLNGYGPYVVAA